MSVTLEEALQDRANRFRAQGQTYLKIIATLNLFNPPKTKVARELEEKLSSVLGNNFRVSVRTAEDLLEVRVQFRMNIDKAWSPWESFAFYKDFTDLFDIIKMLQRRGERILAKAEETERLIPHVSAYRNALYQIYQAKQLVGEEVFGALNEVAESVADEYSESSYRLPPGHRENRFPLGDTKQ